MEKEPPIQFNSKIPAALHKQVKLHCVDKDLDIQDFVRAALEEKLSRDAGAERVKRVIALSVGPRKPRRN